MILMTRDNKTLFPTRFVGLHAHSTFSQYDGLDYPQEHIDYVLENGMDAWSLTDHGNMNGFCHAFLHTEKMKKSGKNFKFIPGCEMYVHPDLGQWKRDLEASKVKPVKDESIITPITAVVNGDDETTDVGTDEAALTVENEDETKSGKYNDPVKRRHHLVVLPKTSIGLQRLFHLVSRGYLEGFYRFPRVDYKMLKEAAEGGHLMVSTACLTGDVELITDRGLECLLSVVQRFEKEEEIFVLSYDEKTSQKEFKKVSWAAMTRKNAKLLRIRTKDGKCVTLTPDHKVFTNKGWLEAQELKEHVGIQILSL
jgi:DNA polymerase III alpha subunit